MKSNFTFKISVMNNDLMKRWSSITVLSILPVFSQRLPEKPEGQLQVGPSLVSTHVPPLEHLKVAQRSRKEQHFYIIYRI